MQKQFFGAAQEILLEANFDIDRAIIFLPGMSGKAHSDRYSGLVKTAEDAGYACARVKIWDNEEEVQAMSFSEIFAKLDEVITALQRIGFIDFALVGKSFGGGVALAYSNPAVSQKILWAPAIGVAEEQGNAAQMFDQKLGEVRNLLDIQLGEEMLTAQTGVVSVIHGSADTIIPYGNSVKIMRIFGGEVREIEGADHSFKDAFHEAKLHEITGDLLQ